MKRFVLAFGVLGAVVLAPTAAFAKDKHKHHHHKDWDDRCDDRRDSGDYDRPYRPYDNCRDYGYRYYSPYDYGRCDRDYRRGGFWIRIN
jgi:hypothetical protein